MTVYKPTNEELNGFEGYLDSVIHLLDGSPLFDNLYALYEELDSNLTDLKDERDELVKKVEDLEDLLDKFARQNEELESQIANMEADSHG
jgi:peptidoglycan hydrolase CwlO-like protein